MNYIGRIIEESFKDKSVLTDVTILKTEIEKVTKKHKTPWLNQWTLHTVEVEYKKADEVAEKFRKSIDTTHSSWYADFKNESIHYIIFPNKIFKIDSSKKEEYEEATQYGISLGIPEYQVDFAPNVIVWER